MIKRLIPILFFLAMSMVLSGCSQSGIKSLQNSSTPVETLSASDLSAIEAGLVASRVLAAESAPAITADVEATGSYHDPFSGPGQGMPPFKSKGHEFKGGKSGNKWKVGRGERGCQMQFDPGVASHPSLIIASESCTVEKTASGGILITRGNGSVLTIDPPIAGKNTGEIQIEGITWNFTWGEDILMTLENTKTGRVIYVKESDDGQLTLQRPGGPPHPARWNNDGQIEGIYPDGQPFRFGGGKFH